MHTESLLSMFKNLILWLFVNAILPICVPALFLAAAEWISDGAFGFIELLISLSNSGFYIFSAATLVFSLYEEFSICRKCIGLIMQTLLVVLMFITLAMFYKIYNGSNEYVSNHQTQFYVIWMLTAVCAGTAKYKILSYKKQFAL